MSSAPPTTDHALLGDAYPDEDVRPLIQRCLQGCQVAMFDLVERFQGRVFGLCFRMLGRREDAEEAAQETFLRVLKSLSHWDSTRDFEPWLLAIAGNRCRTALASRRHRPIAEPLDESDAPAAEHRQGTQELAEEVQQALGKLRAEYREAFILFHEQELSYNDISAALGVPLGTVKTWVHRARRELIEHMRSRGALEDCHHAVPRV
jgi:RNA polymerase sigma-70 factor (ECF subfamily)